eukprot:NODE_919_length_1235_cov_72.346543_g687_i0.p1 GENE.NODE_919_length_1235_cov_72.346543_g687_i0~~NODE_919_length_1235_cov_72.346543_g687_i0.p1  ORF type:complete len:255 (-),score=40.90 NODE_919_length_1235_cov_72.346543_g687_i0:271-1035(-)
MRCITASMYSLARNVVVGSERINTTGVAGPARSQAVAINGSLTALGKVIQALGQRADHVPYRDSTLTMLLRSSLGGRACTSVVVNVSQDAEWADETRCSLEFSQRMSVVRTTATAVVGQEVGGELAMAQQALETTRRALAQMETAGMGERFASDAVPSEIRQFQDNTKRLAAEEAKARAAREALAEAKAKDEGGSTDIERLQQQAAVAEKEAHNLRDILLRQKSIKGFWIPPKPGYLAKLAEFKHLEGQLQMLS